ncbi:VIT1/CCC1 transporter family protein [Salmonirosea aquatica]|uniref:Iron transporter n=1 Tax=Salmonirosea aquatica TaxID=2654236 RepID=A0A7C9BP91_9BACT|nr:iron transporter [Cytophagaceae bacterium SJW1-29]
MNKHQEQHLRNSDFITDTVIGLSDGLTVPFALAAGLSGAVASNGIILTAGIAEIVAGSIAMGLGGYLAGKTEIEHYDSELKREYDEVEAVPEKEKEEIREIFAGYGLSVDSQKQIVEELAKDKDQWVDFMMKFELGLERPSLNRARNSALTIGGAYVVGGFVPLLGYFFTDLPMQGLMVSSVLTIICLFVFGYFKSRATGQPPIQGAFKVLIVGVIAAAAAFLVARFLNSAV